MNRLEYPAQIQWALLPTRIERLSRYSAKLPGVDVWIKRDDLTGFCLSGNKVRKLEFSFARALAEGAEGVVTCGGVNSNHCRATAFLAARLGLDVHLFLRTPDGRPPKQLTANTLLDAIAGAKIHWITPEQYQDRDRLMNQFIEGRAREGTTFALFPEGASNGLGAVGFVKAVEELQGQLVNKNLEIDVVVHALGSGGTTAGLAVGRELLRARWTNLAFAVCDDVAYFEKKVRAIATELEPLGFDPVEIRGLTILDAYKGAAYGATTPEELRFYRRIAQQEGILLDPCYSGKAFFGLHQEIMKGRFPTGSRVLFWHTGGGFANFAYLDEWAEVL